MIAVVRFSLTLFFVPCENGTRRHWPGEEHGRGSYSSGQGLEGSGEERRGGKGREAAYAGDRDVIRVGVALTQGSMRTACEKWNKLGRPVSFRSSEAGRGFDQESHVTESVTGDHRGYPEHIRAARLRVRESFGSWGSNSGERGGITGA